MTNHHYNLPAFAKRIAYPSNREGVADPIEDHVVRETIAADLALLDRDDALLTDLESYCVQEFASCARLVKCANRSAGKKHGTRGARMGNVHLEWPLAIDCTTRQSGWRDGRATNASFEASRRDMGSAGHLFSSVEVVARGVTPNYAVIVCS